MSAGIADQQMLDWFSANRHKVEFYMLHRMYHDLIYRNHIAGLDIAARDFETEELGLLFAAIKMNDHMLSIMGQPLAAPLNAEAISNGIRAAAAADDYDDNAITAAAESLVELANPMYATEWYVLEHYSGIWFMSRKFKQVARAAMQRPAVDASKLLADLAKSVEISEQLGESSEVDAMDDVLFGDSEDMLMRRSTGISGLDACLNGGWGEGECYLMFGGTAAGKSIVAGQVAWHEILTGGYTLIVTTELSPSEYVARMLSCGTDINIGIIQDCRNVKQMREAVARQTREAERPVRMERMDRSISLIKERLHVVKTNANPDTPAGTVLQQEMTKFERKFGRKPTLVILDWLGTLADNAGGGGAGESAARAAAWERSANSCVSFAAKANVATLVLAQAVNNSQSKAVLTIEDIGIAKGIGKNMVAVIGITNVVKKQEILAAGMGRGELPEDNFKPDQLFCACKTRKGPPRNIPVTRDFAHQRFVPRRGGFT